MHSKHEISCLMGNKSRTFCGSQQITNFEELCRIPCQWESSQQTRLSHITRAVVHYKSRAARAEKTKDKHIKETFQDEMASL
jgi:hypothetical protein